MNRREAIFLGRRLAKTLRQVAQPRFWTDTRLNPHSDVRVFTRRRDAAAFRLDLFAMSLFDHPVLRERWTRALTEADSRPGATLPVPAITWDEGTTGRSVHQRFPHRPVVVRGLAHHDPGFRSWDFDDILARFGDEEMILSCPVADRYRGPLRDVDVPGVYLHNSELLLHRHPELLVEAGLPNLLETLGRGMQFTGVAQFFIGRANTGAWWHCAERTNLYTQLVGRKRWRFADPGEAPRMFPVTRGPSRSSFYLSDNVGASTVGHKMAAYADRSIAQDADMQRAYAGCTIQSVVLEPGDVLVIPDWWWHDVENLTDVSIGMSARFFSRKRLPGCAFDHARHANLAYGLRRIRRPASRLVRPDGTLDLDAHGEHDPTASLDQDLQGLCLEPDGDVAAYYRSQGRTYPSTPR